jgi:hypothetical protein
MGLAGRYRIELWGKGAATVGVIDSDDRLDVARALYGRAAVQHPRLLVILCDRARVLTRSDRPETLPLTSG